MSKQYYEIISLIEKKNKKSCFNKPSKDDISNLQKLNFPKELYEFYLMYNPSNIIEINGIRLLPLSEISNENINYTPGYIISPIGYIVIASTIYGDVYCVKNEGESYKIYIASHDEIYEGLNETEIQTGLKEITNSFYNFLKSFYNEELKQDFYE